MLVASRYNINSNVLYKYGNPIQETFLNCISNNELLIVYN